MNEKYWGKVNKCRQKRKKERMKTNTIEELEKKIQNEIEEGKDGYRKKKTEEKI